MSIADKYFAIVTRRRRTLVLLFIAGFAWGYVAKSLMRVHAFTGWHDPKILVTDQLYEGVVIPQPALIAGPAEQDLN